MSILYYCLTFILAYLIGSIPTGVIIGKTFFHEDIRNYGPITLKELVVPIFPEP